jgi:hypothetical protein
LEKLTAMQLDNLYRKKLKEDILTNNIGYKRVSRELSSERHGVLWRSYSHVLDADHSYILGGTGNRLPV